MNNAKKPIHYPTLETDRIELRLLDLTHVSEVYELFADPEVVKYMDIPPCKDLAEAEEIIQFHVDDTGTRWGLFAKDDGRFLGTCGYHCWYQQERRAEIGFDLATAAWGKGYMFEALQPVIRFAFDEMGLDMIEATVDPANERSKRLLEKLGFQKEDELRDNLIYYFLKSKGDHE